MSKYWLGSFVVFQGIRGTIVKEPNYIGDRQRGVKYDLMHPTDGFVNHILKLSLVFSRYDRVRCRHQEWSRGPYWPY